MPNPTPPNDPNRDLLIRLDQKITDGFESIEKKLDKMERKTDAHDVELRALDRRVTIIENTASNIRSGILMIWAVLTLVGGTIFSKVFGMW